MQFDPRRKPQMRSRRKAQILSGKTRQEMKMLVVSRKIHNDPPFKSGGMVSFELNHNQPASSSERLASGGPILCFIRSAALRIVIDNAQEALSRWLSEQIPHLFQQ